MESRNYNSNGDYDLGFANDKGHIEHPVSKLDTLAGIAIKYGVDVADIKKMNGLATDLQMFARKSLQIPLPGKHPPSPCLANGSETSGVELELNSIANTLGLLLELLQGYGVFENRERSEKHYGAGINAALAYCSDGCASCGRVELECDLQLGSKWCVYAGLEVGNL